MYVINVHIVTQQKVDTYVSPVEMLATGIKIFKWQKLSLIAMHDHNHSLLKVLIHRDSKDKGIEFQREQDCVTGVKNLLCSKHYVMLIHHAQIKYRCYDHAYADMLIYSNTKTLAETFRHIAIQNFTTWLSSAG